MVYKITYEISFKYPEEDYEATVYEFENDEAIRTGKTQKIQDTIGVKYITVEEYHFKREKRSK